jgi:ABC-2 type transport system ATP-binding protein
MLSVQDLSYAYDQNLILSHVSFDYKEPKLIGLLGQNGVGKSTLIKLLTGLLIPKSGKIMIDGIEMQVDQNLIKEKIGYLPEKNPLHQDFEVLEYLSWVSRLKGRSNLDETLIEKLGLETVLFKKIATLSKGFKQRVGIAQALLHQPKILILDEPTSGLDLIQVQSFKQLLMDLKKERLILMSTHHLDDLKGVADEILWVKDQQVKQIDIVNNQWVTWQISLGPKTNETQEARETRETQEIELIEIVHQVIQSMIDEKKNMDHMPIQQIKFIQQKKINSIALDPSLMSIDIQMDPSDIPVFNRLLVQHQIHVHAIFKPSIQSIDPFTI